MTTKTLTEAAWIRQQGQPIEEKDFDAPDGFDIFVDLAKKVKSGKEFMAKAQKIHNIPFAVSTWFYDQYNGKNRSMEHASSAFVADVKAGKYD